MKIAMSEAKNSLSEVKGRLDITQENITELEDIVREMIKNETQRKRIFKRGQSGLTPRKVTWGLHGSIFYWNNHN